MPQIFSAVESTRSDNGKQCVMLVGTCSLTIFIEFGKVFNTLAFLCL